MLAVYEILSGKICFQIEAQGQIELSITGDGSRLAFRDGGVIRVLDVVSGGSVVCELKADSSGPVAFSAGGRLLAFPVVGPDSPGQKITIWDLELGQARCFLPASEIVTGLAFSPDGSLLAIQVRDVATDVFRTTDGEREATFPCKMGRGAGFSPDGRTLALFSSGSARLVSLRGETVEELDGVQALAFHPDGRSLLVGREGKAEMLNEKREVVRSYPVPGGGSCSMAAFVADGSRLAVSAYWKRPRVLELETGNAVFEIPFQMGLGVTTALSSDGRFLAVAGDDSWFVSPAGLWAQYFSTPFPGSAGFSPYRFPGLLVHLPVLGLLTQTGWLVCGSFRPLVVAWMVAGLYLGRDLAIAGHYNLLLTFAVWALSAGAWLFGGMRWLADVLGPSPSPWNAGLATAAVVGGLLARAQRSTK